MIKLGMITVLAGLVSLSMVQTANAKVGMFGIYEVENEAAHKGVIEGVKNSLTNQGCHIKLEGSVVMEQGDIDLPTPNRFIYAECEQPVLGSDKHQSLFDPLKSVAEDMALFEGPVQHPEGGNSASRVLDRSYIAKVSYYNNKDPMARDMDLKAIGKSLQGRENIYRAEAEIAVTDAYGAKTPDEAVMIFYDSPEQGDQFRANNKSILKNIGAFNKSHLEDFIYYILKPE